MPPTRQQIIQTARTWLNTPYHHQASTKQIGTDCLGLILGIYKELYGNLPETLPNYSPDWAESSNIETMLNGAQKHLTEIPIHTAKPADIAIFRFRPNTIAKHAAILMPENKMIHAMENTKVSEVNLGPWWKRRIAATFQFPGVQ